MDKDIDVVDPMNMGTDGFETILNDDRNQNIHCRLQSFLFSFQNAQRLSNVAKYGMNN